VSLPGVVAADTCTSAAPHLTQNVLLSEFFAEHSLHSTIGLQCLHAIEASGTLS